MLPNQLTLKSLMVVALRQHQLEQNLQIILHHYSSQSLPELACRGKYAHQHRRQPKIQLDKKNKETRSATQTSSVVRL